MKIYLHIHSLLFVVVVIHKLLSQTHSFVYLFVKELKLPKHYGDERIRTADPLLAKQVLCQLSYTPNFGGPG